MLDTMSAVEYTEWQAYFSIEPFPENRADRRAASIAQAVLAAGGMNKVPKLVELMPDWWDGFHVKQSPEQIQANMELALKRKKKK